MSVVIVAGAVCVLGRSELRRVYHKLKGTVFNLPVLAAADPGYRAAAPLTIFSGGLAPGWEDWSWAEHQLAAPKMRFQEKAVVRMAVVGFKGVYFHHADVSTLGYGAVQCYLSGTRDINLCPVDHAGKFGRPVRLAQYLKPVGDQAPEWRVASVPLSDLGLGRDGSFSGVVFQAAGGAAQPAVYLAEITLQPDTSLPAAPTELPIQVTLDPEADQHPISPYIYGMAFAPPDYLKELRITVNRWGGNDKSRYNWVYGNATNAARDWNWANRGAWAHDLRAPNLVPGPSSAADEFIRQNRAAGAETLLTIPTLGWVAKNSDSNVTSTGVPEFGEDPLTTADGPIKGYDPTRNRERTSVRSLPRKNAPFADPPTQDTVIYQDEWVHHLVRKFGTAAHGVRFYAMDNEPDVWDVTHTDVHPARMGYDDLWEQFSDYAAAVKAVDPEALITGPISSGWQNYFYSRRDLDDDSFRTHPDRKRHNNDPFLLWFLKQARDYEVESGRRTLDVLDIHFYPQGEKLYGGALDSGSQARRLRATRALWDPTYRDESWINDSVQLIPRLKEWIKAGYPGTRIGISEWNFGADDSMNGGLAVADTLGIFGREGIFMANYWMRPSKGSPGYLAFKLFRNADGSGHGFGDQSFRTYSSNQDQLGVYGSTDSRTGTIALILVNKMPSTSANVTLPLEGAGVTRGYAAKTWQVSADAPNSVIAGPSVQWNGGQAHLLVKPYSMVLLRVEKAN